jgi:hypothetical protein
MSAMTRVLWIALLVACGHPAPVPAPPQQHVQRPPDAAPRPDGPLDQDLPRLAARSVQLYQEIAAAFAAAGEDCASAAQKLGSLQATYADVVVANATVLHQGRARELREALGVHMSDLDAAAKAIVQSPTMMTCSKDGAFTDAFDKLVGAPP